VSPREERVRFLAASPSVPTSTRTACPGAGVASPTRSRRWAFQRPQVANDLYCEVGRWRGSSRRWRPTGRRAPRRDRRGAQRERGGDDSAGSRGTATSLRIAREGPSTRRRPRPSARRVRGAATRFIGRLPRSATDGPPRLLRDGHLLEQGVRVGNADDSTRRGLRFLPDAAGDESCTAERFLTSGVRRQGHPMLLVIDVGNTNTSSGLRGETLLTTGGCGRPERRATSTGSSWEPLRRERFLVTEIKAIIIGLRVPRSPPPSMELCERYFG